MNCRPWPLEEYDLRGTNAAVPANTNETDIDEVRLEAFDKGYKAGWEDAAQAHQKDQMHISAELAHNLQAMSFSYHEARAATIKDTEVLFRGMIDSVLPKVMPASLTGTVLDRLLAGVDAATQPMVEVTVAPENVERLEHLIEGAIAPPLRICPEPSLGPGQAMLRFEHREERVDLHAVLAELETIAEDLLTPDTTEKEQLDAG